MRWNAENLLLLAAIGFGVYFVLSRSSAGAAPSVQIIPPGEPLQIIPEPAALAPSIPPLRGSVDGIGRSRPWTR